MNKLVGKIIGGAAAGAFAIGGAVTVSQLDTQTEEINKQVTEMNALAEKVGEEFYCYAVTNECAVVDDATAEYESLNTANDELLEEYNTLVDKYNSECAEDGIDESEEQKCLDLNNNAAKMVEELYKQLEELDKFVLDIE